MLQRIIQPSLEVLEGIAVQEAEISQLAFTAIADWRDTVDSALTRIIDSAFNLPPNNRRYSLDMAWVWFSCIQCNKTGISYARILQHRCLHQFREYREHPQSIEDLAVNALESFSSNGGTVPTTEERMESIIRFDCDTYNRASYLSTICGVDSSTGLTILNSQKRYTDMDKLDFRITCKGCSLAMTWSRAVSTSLLTAVPCYPIQ